MTLNLYVGLKKKKSKTELKWEFIRYYKALLTISEILQSEEKLEISGGYAVSEIRRHLEENIWRG